MIYQHHLHDIFPCRDQSVFEKIITDKIGHVPLLQVSLRGGSGVIEEAK